MLSGGICSLTDYGLSSKQPTLGYPCPFWPSTLVRRAPSLLSSLQPLEARILGDWRAEFRSCLLVFSLALSSLRVSFSSCLLFCSWSSSIFLLFCSRSSSRARFLDLLLFSLRSWRRFSRSLWCCCLSCSRRSSSSLWCWCLSSSMRCSSLLALRLWTLALALVLSEAASSPGLSGSPLRASWPRPFLRACS